MKKRILGIFMAAALLLGVFPTVLPAAAEDIFVLDVPVEASFEDASGINLTFALNPYFVTAAEELEGTRADVLDGKMMLVHQKGDRLNVGIASDTPFSFSGTLFTLRLHLRIQTRFIGEDDEVYKLIKSKVDEEPAWQTDAVLLRGVRDGGAYKDSVSVIFNEGSALLNGEPYEANTSITDEGDYCLQITDLSGRVRTVRFVIDRTPPVITIAPYDDTRYTKGPLTVYASVNEGTLNQESHTFTENGDFMFIATDAAGNRDMKLVSISHLYAYSVLRLEKNALEPTSEDLTVFTGERLDLTGWWVWTEYHNKEDTLLDQEGVPVTEEMLTYTTEEPGDREAVLRLNGEELRFTIHVKDPKIFRVEVKQPPKKTEYIQYQELDPAGLELEVTYDNGDIVTVTEGWEPIAYDFTTPGPKTLIVRYQGRTTQFEVTVVPRTLQSIEVTRGPNVTEYVVGTTQLNLNGLELALHYDSGSVDIVDYSAIQQELEISFDFSEAGEQEVLLTYQGKTASFIVTVIPRQLTSISVSKEPDKTEYYSDELFDDTGMELTLRYNDGTTQVVTEGWTVDCDFGEAEPGSTRYPVTITYQGKETTLHVTVTQVYVTSIAVTKLPKKQSYLQGEEFDPEGMEVTLTYNSGRTALADGWQVEYDFSEPGQQEVTVYCSNQKTSFTVTVRPRSLTRIEVHSPPEKTVYIVGESLALDGLDVWAYFDNGESEPISSYRITGYDRTQTGVQTLTVTYEGKTASFTVTVQAKSVSSIAMKSNPSKTTYLAGEALNLAGAKITVRYNNNTSEDIAVTSSMVSGYNADKVGSQTITVTYAGKSTSFKVTVQSRVPSSITSSTYSISGGFISKIGAGTTVSQLLNGINEKAYCKVYKDNAEVSGDTPADTGMEVRLLDGSTVKAKVTVVVTGDTNGDGNITITDMLAVKSHLLKKSTLSGAAAKAADTSGDKAISITDFIQIKAHILGKDKVQARAC